MALFTLTVEAQAAVAKYRQPAIGVWRAAIDPVLLAAGETTLGRDAVTDITLAGDHLSINTSYSALGCTHDDIIVIPISLLRADNPVHAANLYRLEGLMAAAKNQLARAQTTVAHAAKRVASLEDELAAARALK